LRVTSRRHIAALALPVLLLAIAVLAAPANAATTRAEYVAQVDPICHAADTRMSAVIRSLKKSAKQLKQRGIDTEEPTKPVVRVAVRGYNRIALIARNAFTQISVVTAAPGDETTVSAWLRQLSREIDRFQRAIHAFAHRKVHRYKQLMYKSSLSGLEADVLVRDFGFQYCGK
jgi:hypothetical protein